MMERGCGGRRVGERVKRCVGIFIFLQMQGFIIEGKAGQAAR